MLFDRLASDAPTLIAGGAGAMREAVHALLHEAVHAHPGSALLLDGAHVYNPYDAAELNLQRGIPAAAGADRTLIRRCLTPFQWHQALALDLDGKLAATSASVVVVAPFERPFSSDELEDWERLDYAEHALAQLATVARRHRVPIAIAVHMDSLWRHHPALGKLVATSLPHVINLEPAAAWEALPGEASPAALAARLPRTRRGHPARHADPHDTTLPRYFPDLLPTHPVAPLGLPVPVASVGRPRAR